VLAAALLLPGATQALEKDYVGEGPVDPAEAGWVGTIRLGANLNFTHNQDVVGQMTGSAVTLGGNFDGLLTYARDGHDWRNNLSLLEGFTYGPPINRFMKTTDRLLFESVYYYHPEKLKWLGPFARFVLDTAIFENTNHQATVVDYHVVNEPDAFGSPKVFSQRKSLHLSESFLPLTLKESVGVYANPIRTEAVEVLIRAGFGSHQVFADGQLALSDDPATANIIEVQRMKDYVQGGFEAALVVQGAFYNKKIGYKVYGETMIPSIRQKEAGDNRSAISLTNVELGALLSFKLVSWASIDYTFKALRQPQLVDDWQIQNMLLLTFSYTYTKKSAPPPAPPAPEAAPEAAPAAAPAS
jgi:hypothetical protein